MNEKNNSGLVIFLLLLFVGVLVFFRGLDIKYYADDLQIVYRFPGEKVFYYLSNVPADGFYRPIQLLLVTVSQTLFGYNTVLIHLIQLLTHIIFCWIIYLFMTESGLSRIKSVIASLFMLLSPTNAFAILNNDTFSQITGAMFGFLSLVFLFRCFNSKKEENEKFLYLNPNFLISIFCFGISLFSKESSLSFLLIFFAAIALYDFQPGDLKKNIRKLIVYLSPYVIMLLIYLSARYFAGGRQPASGKDEAYAFIFGKNIISNYALSVISSIMPFPNEVMFEWIKKNDYLSLLAPGIIIIIFTAVVIYGLIKSGKKKLILSMIIFFFLSLIPMIFLIHIRELHSYNSAAYVSVLVGIGAGTVIEQTGKNGRWKKVFVISFMAFVFITEIVSIESRISKMKSNGEKAWILIDQIIPYTKYVPENGKLILLNPVNDQIEYSVLVMNDFNVLFTGLQIINELSGRTDFQPLIVNSSEINNYTADKNNLILTIESNQVKKFE